MILCAHAQLSRFFKHQSYNLESCAMNQMSHINFSGALKANVSKEKSSLPPMGVGAIGRHSVAVQGPVEEESWALNENATIRGLLQTIESSFTW